MKALGLGPSTCEVFMNDREHDDEEKRGILRWLFDALFGRRAATEEEIGEHIHRLGSIRRRLGER